MRRGEGHPRRCRNKVYNSAEGFISVLHNKPMARFSSHCSVKDFEGAEVALNVRVARELSFINIFRGLPKSARLM